MNAPKEEIHIEELVMCMPDDTHIKALLRDPNTCVAELARDYGVSRTTIYKHCGVVQPRHD